MVKLNNERHQGILENLARMMVNFKSGEKPLKRQVESQAMVSSMILSQRKEKSTHPTRPKVGDGLKSTLKEIKGFDCFHANDHVTDSDAKSTSASKNKPGYFNVIKSLHIGECRDASSSDDDDVKLIKSNDRLNKTMINLS